MLTRADPERLERLRLPPTRFASSTFRRCVSVLNYLHHGPHNVKSDATARSLPISPSLLALAGPDYSTPPSASAARPPSGATSAPMKGFWVRINLLAQISQAD